MTGILTHVGKIQDAKINWQEARYRRNAERQQQASLHRERMTCADTVRFDTQSQDWTGGMGISPSGRFRVIETAKTRKNVFSGEGIRWDVACISIVAILVLCVALVLADLAGIGMGDRSLNKLDRKITEMAGKNDKLQAEITLRNDDITVYSEAAKMNLISASSAQTIRIHAPENVKLTISGGYHPGD